MGAEERGQAQAIAENMYEMSRLETPIICVVIGEGGSGGALGIGVGDRVAMLQYAYYSVISPEGCAGILWKSHEYAERAAEALRFTSSHLLEFGVIDDVIEEPLGAAHRDHHQVRQSAEDLPHAPAANACESGHRDAASGALREVPSHGCVPGFDEG